MTFKIRIIELLFWQKSSLSLMLYLADNLAYIPFTVLDEPLYVIHHIDIKISVAGSNLLQTFKEVRREKCLLQALELTSCLFTVVEAAAVCRSSVQSRDAKDRVHLRRGFGRRLRKRLVASSRRLSAASRSPHRLSRLYVASRPQRASKGLLWPNCQVNIPSLN